MSFKEWFGFKENPPSFLPPSALGTVAKFTVTVGEVKYAVGAPTFGRFFGVCNVLGVKDFGEGLIKSSVEKLIKVGLLPVQTEPVDLPDAEPQVLSELLSEVWAKGKLEPLLLCLLEGYKGLPEGPVEISVAEVEAALLYFFMTYSNASIPLAVQAMLSAAPSRNSPKG